MTDPVFWSIVLAFFIAAGALAICSAHIPILRDWTNAPPLEKEEE